MKETKIGWRFSRKGVDKNAYGVLVRKPLEKSIWKTRELWNI